MPVFSYISLKREKITFTEKFFSIRKCPHYAERSLSQYRAQNMTEIEREKSSLYLYSVCLIYNSTIFIRNPQGPIIDERTLRGDPPPPTQEHREQDKAL
jgi:hypothetical protein